MPSQRYRGRSSIDRFRQTACSVPYVQRTRCFSRPSTSSGTSVNARASSSWVTRQPVRCIVRVRSQSSAKVWWVKPPTARIASRRHAAQAPGTMAMALSASWAPRSTPIWTRYSNACHRVSRFWVRLPTRTTPATAPRGRSPCGRRLSRAKCRTRLRTVDGVMMVSASRVTTMSPRATRKPWLRASALPVFSCVTSRTRGSVAANEATTEAVSSRDPSSTTTTSVSGRSPARMCERVRPMTTSSL